MRNTFAIVALVLVAQAAGAESATAPAAQQFAFAQSLADAGELNFALLEYKRFVFENPTHAEVPNARYQMIQIQLTMTQDVVGAKKQLQSLAADHPQSEPGRRAKALVEFIDMNSDFDGTPLRLFLGAQAAAVNRDYAKALEQYLALLKSYPRARLADRALFEAATLQRDSLQRPGDARMAFLALPDSYPNSPYAPEALYQAAQLTEQAQGGEKAATDLYRKLAAEYPASEAGKRAAARLKAVEKEQNPIPRQFAAEQVLAYTAKQAGYTAAGGKEYEVLVELAPTATTAQVQATLEQVLIDRQKERKQPADSMKVTAYFNYPYTKAGTATWAPGQVPAYAVEKRKGGDVLKDTFIDLLKKK